MESRVPWIIQMRLKYDFMLNKMLLWLQHGSLVPHRRFITWQHSSIDLPYNKIGPSD